MTLDNSATVLVIGGSGFLGSHLVEYILSTSWKGHIRITDIRPPSDEFMKQYRDRVSFVQGDICSLQSMLEVCKGVHTVFHTASPPEGRPRDLYMKVNVGGTNNIIQAAIQSNVKQIVYTSTASVVFDGTDIKGGDETIPYVTKFIDPYIETKIMAEKAILEANGKNGLATCALRPSGIFGPRDAQAWPGIIAAGKAGQTKYQIGSGKNLMDWTYVVNIAYAHWLAAEKIESSESPAAGQAFFITNDEPLPFWDMPKFVCGAMGYPLPSRVLPATLLLILAIIIDFFVWILSPIVTLKPTLTYFRVVVATRNRSFNISKAKRILGYKPIVPLSEALSKTLEYFQNLK